ncbi:hypothetical protein H696_04947 [Fonticula alba]|uniref:RNA helicase n=1 Tax=Fonticula alba TaxID=691883 RepID=A0A058Z3E5_FONAL|nr:hypothetical protein H696_04947 [Fonticula alba]KCV68656.1 hypothetical protein H696_04947 [Fonticula alba]|eukprot:XP_009497088.1 hypothetical protein H696_04947 [Fonticula alba]
MRSACIYGGSSYEAQARQIQSGVDILVATPGRLIDLINNRHCDLSEVSVVALDEADEMMSPSFSDDIQFMLSQAQRDRQMLLFSATMPPSVSSLVNRCMSPNYHTIDTASTAVPSKIAHFTFPIRGHASRSLTASLLVSSLRPRRTIVFSNKKTDCTEIAERMQSTGIAAAPVHSDLSQSVRTDLMNRFRKGTLKVLVATDVAARGIDIPECDLVIHTEPPTSLESYVHRSGRTGRAGRTGVVAMFDDGQSNQLLRDISNRAELSFVDAPTENDFALYSVSDAIDRILEVDDAIAAHYLPSVDLLISRHGDARSVLAKAVACNAEGSRKMIQDMYREPVRHQFSRGGDRDRGFGGRGDRDRGGRGDRGFGGDRDRGFGGRGDRDRGGRGDRDRGGRGFGGRGSGYGNDFGY